MDQQTAASSATDDAPFDATRVIARNGVLGAIVAFAITFVVCLLAGQGPVVAAGVSSMPALFAGPLVAGLMTVIEYHHYEESHPAH